MRLKKITIVKQESLLELKKAQQALEQDIHVATEYIKLIEQGKLDDLSAYAHQSPHGEVLVNSLFSMRDQMKRYNQEQAQRRWVNEGLAKFVEILRSSHDLKGLSESIIQHLVRYVNGNQGALFVLNDDVTTDTYLDMIACYAFDRKKHQTKRIEIGEGIIGQVYLEKQTIYLTDVPKDFVRITSGLGEAPPRYVLICPLKLNDDVYGIVELASFKPFEPYQIKFIERLGENIASTISTAKINERTQLLLSESRQQAEELRSQEEEMRQNMEELAATQEEMHRILTEVQGKESFVSGLINATQDLVIAIDTEYKLVAYNNAVVELYKGFGLTIEKGMSVMALYEEGEQRDKYMQFYKRAFRGESFEVTEHYTFQGKEQYYAISYSPLRDESGQVNGVVSFEKNVTESVESKLRAEELLQTSQQHTEELKAQEEELRQNMEELAATQEEMQRILTEVQGKESFVTGLINATQDLVIAIDTEYKLVAYNNAVVELYKGFGLTIEKGMSAMVLYEEGEQREKYVQFYQRAFRGESFEVTEHYTFQGKEQYYAISYSPLRDERGQVNGVVSFEKNVTESVESKLRAEELLRTSQQDTEELKAQEEELRQQMEELSTTQEKLSDALKTVATKEQMLQDMMDLSSESMVIIDREYAIVDYNKLFAAPLEQRGIPIGKGLAFLAIMPPKMHEERKKIFARVLKGETVEALDSIPREDGSDRYLAVKHAPMKGADGKVERIAIFARDVTHLHAPQAKHQIH